VFPWLASIGWGHELLAVAPSQLNFIDLLLVEVLSLEESGMISFRQRLQCLPLLFGGITAGLVLAAIAWTSRGAETTVIVLVAVLPFLLAILTGVAKTTTA
jgi:hypothetical protein